MRTRILGIVLTIVLTMSCLFSDCTLASVEAATNVCITLDNDLSDWDYIQKMYTGEGRLLQMAAFQTDDSIYIMRELDDMALYGGEQMFFDTDGDNTNGYQGGDWLLQGGNLHYYNSALPNQWADDTWAVVADAGVEVKITQDSMIAEYKIPISAFGNDFDAEKFGVNLCPSDVNWGTFVSFPASTTEYAKVPKYEAVYTPSNTPVLSDVKLNLTGGGASVQAITDPTMPGGVVGTLSASGGDGKNYTYRLATNAIYGVDNSKFTISGNQLIVKDTMLAPGSYSIYVKVNSDIRSVRVPINFMVTSADASAVITENVFSGMNGQWFAVNHNAANTVPTLKSLKAATDGKNLYAFVDASSLSHNSAFYIATPNSTDGAKIDTWADSSNVKYKVDMNGVLYEYDGDWKSVGNVTILKTETGAEIAVPISMIGNVGAMQTIRVGVKDGETCYLPNKGVSMYAVTTPYLSEMPKITADGNPSDWEGIEPIASGTGTVGDVYAVHDDNYLYVMTTFTGVDQADWDNAWAISCNLLINGDGDATTGLQHEGYYKESGADFLLQDWYSVGSSKECLEFFYGTDAGSLGTARANNLDWKKFGKLEEEGTYCIEYAVPISKMREYCTTVSDDMYIAVNRQLEGYPSLQTGFTDEGHMDSISYVHVPKYNTKVSVSAKDGAFGDWKLVSRQATNTATESTCNLLATRSEERLYTLVTNDLGGMNTVNTYYISTGDDTGYSISGYSNIDYIVKDAKLFKMVADNTMSEALDDVWMSYYNNSVEMQMYLEQIGNPETIKIAWSGMSGKLQIPATDAEDRMLDVTATFDMKREAGYFYPVEDFGSYSNPYKGWAIWGIHKKAGETISETVLDYDNGLYHFESNLIYIALTWKDLQPKKPSDDKEVRVAEFKENLKKHLDKFDVERWVERGKRINLRFMMDNTDYVYAEYAEHNSAEWGDGKTWAALKKAFEEAEDKTPEKEAAEAALMAYYEEHLKFERMDIPMWLYEELVEESKANGNATGSDAGVFYWDRTGDELGIGYDQAGFAPNYYSRNLIDRHKEVIELIAEYWDNNQITGHVMVGSLGHWGEFHVWPEGSGIWPTVDILDEYISHYDAFTKVKVGIRKPYPAAAERNYGLFNDIFGSDVEWGINGTQQFYGYFMNGNTDMGAATGADGYSNGAGAGTAEQVEASKMPDFWKYNWSGGEFANGQIRIHVNNDTSKDGTRGIMGVLDETRYCHVSWMGPCGPSNYMVGELDAVLQEANVLAMQKLMGYNYALEKVTKANKLYLGKTTNLSMTWNNKGVAPFYYEWPLEMSLIDADGKVAYKQIIAVDEKKGTDITKWLPGRQEATVGFTVPGSLAEGEYTLAVAILDKDSGEPAIRMLLDVMSEDKEDTELYLRHPLYTVSVEKAPVTPSGGSSGGSTTTTPETTTPEATTPGSTTTTTTTTTTPEDTTTEDVTSDDVVTEETVKVEVEDLTDAIKDAEEGTVFETDMEEDAVLDAEVIETLAESKVEVVLNIGKGISWTINSADVTSAPTASIDLKVTLHTQNIPTDLVESVKEAVQEAVAEVVQFNIAHNGDFGFKATLTLPVGKAHHGKKATLFYHNTEAGTMDNMGDAKVDKDGNVRFPFTHASDYVIVLSGAVEDVPEADTDTDVTVDGDVDTTTPDADVDTDVAPSTPDGDSDGSSLWIVIAIIAVALIAAGVCVFQFVIKKKGENGDE